MDTEESRNYIALHGGRGQNDGADYTLDQEHLEGKFRMEFLYDECSSSSKFADIKTVNVRCFMT